MLMDRTKSLTERRAEAMADKAGYTADHAYGDRHPYMIGVMGSCAEEMERVLAEIASGKLRAANARRLAQSALDSVKGGAA